MQLLPTGQCREITSQVTNHVGRHGHRLKRDAPFQMPSNHRAARTEVIGGISQRQALQESDCGRPIGAISDPLNHGFGDCRYGCIGSFRHPKNDRSCVGGRSLRENVRESVVHRWWR